MLTKDKILSADDLPKEVVNIDEWGDDVIVSTMNAKNREAYERYYRDNKLEDEDLIRASLCAFCLVDEEGSRLFGLDDIVSLADKSSKVIGKLFLIAQRLNGLREQDLEEAAGE